MSIDAKYYVKAEQLINEKLEELFGKEKWEELKSLEVAHPLKKEVEALELDNFEKDDFLKKLLTETMLKLEKGQIGKTFTLTNPFSFRPSETIITIKIGMSAIRQALENDQKN